MTAASQSFLMWSSPTGIRARETVWTVSPINFDFRETLNLNYLQSKCAPNTVTMSVCLCVCVMHSGSRVQRVSPHQTHQRWAGLLQERSFRPSRGERSTRLTFCNRPNYSCVWMFSHFSFFCVCLWSGANAGSPARQSPWWAAETITHHAGIIIKPGGGGSGRERTHPWGSPGVHQGVTFIQHVGFHWRNF